MRFSFDNTQTGFLFWQLPLVLVFAVDPGPYILLCWAVSIALMQISKWRVFPVLLGLVLLGLHSLHPAPGVEFFIGMLIIIMPLSWLSRDGRKISPTGLAPTIFLVGSVFIFHAQFYVLIFLVAWLLGFLLWFSMIYAGWSTQSLRIHWLGFLGLAFLASVVTVLIFALVPKIKTGAIPSFAHSQQIRLTDHLHAGGMTDLMADDGIAFRAFPHDEVSSLTPYWRVYTLDRQGKQGWSRSQRKYEDAAAFPRMNVDSRRLDILAEGHDLAYLPVPGWPAPNAGGGYHISSFAEVKNTHPSRRHARVDIYDALGGLAMDTRPWQGGVSLGDRGRLAIWAEQQRRHLATDRDFADFLMAVFHRDFIYSRRFGDDAGNSTQALDIFFFERKSGHCSFFAQALATAFRSAGIPAMWSPAIWAGNGTVSANTGLSGTIWRMPGSRRGWMAAPGSDLIRRRWSPRLWRIHAPVSMEERYRP